MLNNTGFDLWADGYDKSVGLSDVTRDFGKKLAAESEVLYPDSAAASVYDKAYQKYKAVYQNTKTLF